jgi:hypothetical protein
MEVKEKKNYKEVEREFQENAPNEYRTVKIVNKMMLKYYPEFINLGVIFRGQPYENRFDKFDCKLVWIKDGKEIILALGELEYGKDQNRYDEPWKNWNRAFPVDFWYCVSLLSRKKYDNNFQFFLKVSPTFKSAFVFDTRNNFVSENKDDEYEMPNDSINEQYDTNKWRIAFNWDTVRKHQIEFEHKRDSGKDVVKIKKDGNICLMEYEYWNEIIAFFAYKFFPEELKAELKKQKRT